MKKHFVLLVLAVILTCGMLTGVTSSKYMTKVPVTDFALLVNKQPSVTVSGNSSPDNTNPNNNNSPNVIHNSSGTISISMIPRSGTNDRIKLELTVPSAGRYKLSFNISTSTNGGVTWLIHQNDGNQTIASAGSEYTLACIAYGNASNPPPAGNWMDYFPSIYEKVDEQYKLKSDLPASQKPDENKWRAITMRQGTSPNYTSLSHNVELTFEVDDNKKVYWEWNWSDVPDNNSTTMTLSNIKLEKVP